MKGLCSTVSTSVSQQYLLRQNGNPEQRAQREVVQSYAHDLTRERWVYGSSSKTVGNDQQ